MRKVFFACLSLTIICCLSGCGNRQADQKERKEISYTVVAEPKLPEKLREILEKNKQGEMRFSFEDGEDLYLVRGYGEQKTGGYSVAVAECSEDEDTIWFDARLLGPESQDVAGKDPSYPYVTVKMKANGKEIMIQ